MDVHEILGKYRYEIDEVIFLLEKVEESGEGKINFCKALISICQEIKIIKKRLKNESKQRLAKKRS